MKQTPSKNNNIIFFASRPDWNASNRYRIYKLAQVLEQEGIKCIVCPPYSNTVYARLINRPGKLILFVTTVMTFFRRIWQMRHLRNYHIAVVQQEMMRLFPPLFEYFIKRCGKTLILDFDDANFALHQLAGRKYSWRLYDSRKTEKIIRISDYVFAGSDYLMEYARGFTDKTAKIPTAVDIERYSVKTGVNAYPVIGWMGSSATLKYLEPLDNVFEKLRQKGYQFTVRIVCNQPFHFKSVTADNKRWRLEDEIADLNSFDIGIMPMPDDEFSRAKCGFKIIQYMATGIPVVCSPVGENVRIAGRQDSCLLAGSGQEWVDKLSLLLDNPQLRQSMGQCGRKTVRQKYTIRENAIRIREIINAL
jgi:glycosyltransferase involved in cell wall biosynthesis